MTRVRDRLVVATVVLLLAALVSPIGAPAASGATDAPQPGVPAAPASLDGPANITSDPPPPATVTTPYSHTFTDERPDVTWSVTAGSLPAGLELDADTGELSGTPLVLGTRQFTVTATSDLQVVDIDAGARHTCAVDTDNALLCWGHNDNNEATPPAGTYTAVAAADGTSCAIATDATLACWGRDDLDQATPPAGTYTAISGYSEHFCAIATDQTIACWGTDSGGQTIPPPGTYTAVAVGVLHSCAVATDQTIACWGTDSGGQTIPPPGTHTAIAAGAFHGCAIATDQSATCWGFDSAGQVEAPAGAYTAVTAGNLHSCAIATDQTATCWGTNSSGQSSPPAGAVTHIAAGYTHTCTIAADATPACFGNPSDGRTDVPPNLAHEVVHLTVDPLAPLDAPPSEMIMRHGVPFNYSFAPQLAERPDATLTIDETALPDGVTFDGTTLTGTPSDAASFIAPLDPTLTYEAPLGMVSASFPATCALQAVGDVACVGVTDGSEFQAPGPYRLFEIDENVACGIRASDDSAVCYWFFPSSTEVHPGPFVDLDVGPTHACAVRADNGHVDCWGDDDFGKASPPEDVAFVSVNVGNGHSCGVRADGDVQCWGRSDFGEANPQTGPFTAVAVGGFHTCALRADNSAQCWGADNVGQSTDQAGPFLELRSGFNGSCGLLATDRSVECWGDTAGSGQPLAGPFSTFSEDAGHGCGIRVDTGGTECWGSNPSGADTSMPGITEETLEVDVVVTGGPTITALPDQTLADNDFVPQTVFAWSDLAGTDVALTATSSNQALLPDGNISLSDSGLFSTLSVTPAPGEFGSTTVTATTTDPWGFTASSSFQLHVVAPGGTVAGSITDTAGDPLADALVAVWSDSDGWSPTAYTSTGPDGSYLLGGLPDGTYRLAAIATSTNGLQVRWWDGAILRSTATPLVIVDADTALADIDLELPAVTTVTGTVTGPDTTPVDGATVRAWPTGALWFPAATATTGPDGTYTLTNLPSGELTIQVLPPPGSGLAPQWWDGAATRTTATPLTLTAGDAISDIDAQLVGANTASGTVTGPDTTPVEGTTVALYRTGQLVPVALTSTAADGTWTLEGFPDDTYRLRFIPPAGSGLTNQWWNGATTAALATPLTFTDSTTIGDLDTQLTGA
ncbi:MAG: carboxypeptidase regulatory-like domain-containing protein [Acidimicrobiia bacterium]|nr:carboxypeptidase regulatory-like domain-containing protein [Acidimicrobiia bacterium]